MLSVYKCVCVGGIWVCMSVDMCLKCMCVPVASARVCRTYVLCSVRLQCVVFNLGSALVCVCVVARVFSKEVF